MRSVHLCIFKARPQMIDNSELKQVTFLTTRTSTGSKVDVFHQSQPLTQSMGVPGGGRRGWQPHPPQFVGQTKPVGQYSLHSRAILAYYKNKWDKFCQILWEILSILWEICYLIGIFRNHSSPPPPPPVDNNFGKFLRKIFFDNSGTIRKSRVNFFPPP